MAALQPLLPVNWPRYYRGPVTPHVVRLTGPNMGSFVIDKFFLFYGGRLNPDFISRNLNIDVWPGVSAPTAFDDFYTRLQARTPQDYLSRGSVYLEIIPDVEIPLPTAYTREVVEYFIESWYYRALFSFTIGEVPEFPFNKQQALQYGVCPGLEGAPNIFEEYTKAQLAQKFQPPVEAG